jgi:hypothetical protein
MNKADSIAEAKRRGTLYEVPSRQALGAYDGALAKLHLYDVVLIGGKLAKNRFGDIEIPLFK